MNLRTGEIAKSRDRCRLRFEQRFQIDPWCSSAVVRADRRIAISSAMKLIRLLCAAAILAVETAAFGLSDSELDRIGRRVWQNECGGRRDGLTSWNVGEDFASLGIGHFIWYPKGMDGPFEESFPKLVRFYEQHGVKVPTWLRGDCPWTSRA